MLKQAFIYGIILIKLLVRKMINKVQSKKRILEKTKNFIKSLVSDIDGTVTKSDVVGQLSNIVYYEYSHHGIHNLYNNIAK